MGKLFCNVPARVRKPEAPQGRLLLSYIARRGFPVIVNTVPILIELSFAAVAGTILVIHVPVIIREHVVLCCYVTNGEVEPKAVGFSQVLEDFIHMGLVFVCIF